MSYQATSLDIQYHPYSFQYLKLYLFSSLLSILGPIRNGAVIKQARKEVAEKGDVEMWNMEVPSRDKGRTITVTAYRKKDLEENGGLKKAPKVHLNFHGSGFVIPSLGTDTEFCAFLAAQLPNTIVLDCDYRKAPFVPFPGYHNDALDIVSFLQSQKEDYNTSKLTLSGFSAGGNVAMGLALTLGPDLVKGLISFYGVVAPSTGTPAPEKKFDFGIILPDGMLDFFYDCAFVPSQDRTDIRVSPSRAEAIKWPKFISMNCGKADSLFTPTWELVQRLRRESEEAGLGLNVDWVAVEKGAHGWDKGTTGNQEAERIKLDVYENVVEMIGKAQGS